MSLIGRGLFVIGGIAIGSFLLNHFVFGNTGDSLVTSARVGEWRKAEIREACFPATENPEKDSQAPKMPAGQNRISTSDLRRAAEMTVALNCYVVTKGNAICQPDNRAYVIDYIGRYYAKRDEMIATARTYGEAEIRNVRQVWNSPRNQAIEAALANHIKNGRLKKSDFGWSNPKPLAALFEQNADAADRCASEPRQAAKS
jgi:hypothetical protein